MLAFECLIADAIKEEKIFPPRIHMIFSYFMEYDSFTPFRTLVENIDLRINL
jgi:hypothetical protein